MRAFVLGAAAALGLTLTACSDSLGVPPDRTIPTFSTPVPPTIPPPPSGIAGGKATVQQYVGEIRTAIGQIRTEAATFDKCTGDLGCATSALTVSTAAGSLDLAFLTTDLRLGDAPAELTALIADTKAAIKNLETRFDTFDPGADITPVRRAITALLTTLDRWKPYGA
jgi:hypothetical protein